MATRQQIWLEMQQFLAQQKVDEEMKRMANATRAGDAEKEKEAFDRMMHYAKRGEQYEDQAKSA